MSRLTITQDRCPTTGTASAAILSIDGVAVSAHREWGEALDFVRELYAARGVPCKLLMEHRREEVVRETITAAPEVDIDLAEGRP